MSVTGMYTPTRKNWVRFPISVYTIGVLASFAYLATHVGVLETMSVWTDARLPLLALIFAGFGILVFVFIDRTPAKTVFAYSIGPFVVESLAVSNFIRDMSTVPISTLEWGMLIMRFLAACLLIVSSAYVVYNPVGDLDESTGASH